ncbi:phage integrase Arm DNA-binding domain-containing protein [Vibrio penaeicida]|uniref:Integrase n=2 Tax=Vibrio penaeicida TaxID=104609 RepID=A0AAV5NRJ8_9VIBR|nr:phage integrase Arm DNA-binding domain-containing protein [Vibrio penaeicida]RTZ24292.1 integrase [Vibrio penaeicida]GLQ72882.1 integrase [Vibrio penaeicida]
MAARPRSHQIDVENLYQKFDKRTGKVYFQYKDPRTGKFHGLGCDKSRAMSVAKDLNQRINQQLADHFSYLLNADSGPDAKGVLSTRRWCEQYLKLQDDRLKEGEIVESTIKSKRTAIRIINARCGHLRIDEVTTRVIVAILNEYRKANKTRMAQVIRGTWIDIYKEAQYAGEVEPGFNPPLATKPPKSEVKRSRLSESDWAPILAAAIEEHSPFLVNAMKLALTTGLRREDIVRLRFKDVKDGYLQVATNKSRGKTKLAFPLALTNPLLNESLESIIDGCRERKFITPYLIHHARNGYGVKCGDKVHPGSLTQGFREARNATLLKWEGTEPTFHEIRSLAERTYYAIGLDTQTLLGHKSQTMTDRYHDNRGREYTKIALVPQ